MNQLDAPSILTGKFTLRKLALGETRRVGDFYMNQFGELNQIDHDISYFQRKITLAHCPHYRVVNLDPFKKNKIVVMIDNGRKVYR